MEDALAILVVFGVLAFIVVSFIRAVVRWRETGKQAAVMIRLIDTVGTSEDAGALLESSTLQSFVERAVDRRTMVLGRVIRAVQSGIVLLVVGATFFLIRSIAAGQDLAGPDEYFGFTVLGTIAIALGVAFFLAAGASYGLSSRWGLIDGPGGAG